MNLNIIYQERSKNDIYEAVCPYSGVNTCMASFSSMIIDEYKRKSCCATENYDNCPIFLSTILRRK